MKICTFCGMQKFLHKSSQTQQMLKKSSNSKSLAKIDVFLSPNFNCTTQKMWKIWLYQSYSELYARFVFSMGRKKLKWQSTSQQKFQNRYSHKAIFLKMLKLDLFGDFQIFKIDFFFSFLVFHQKNIFFWTTNLLLFPPKHF